MEYENQIIDYIDYNKEIFTRLSDDIWGFSEIRFEEYHSVKAQIEVLRDAGFTVETGQSGMDTAFIASYGSGQPVIGLLGEFDALSDLSQKADSYVKESLEGKNAGHGCGHHLLGVASIASAMAVKNYIDKNNISGTLRYYGCPAEESGGGKTFLVRDGYFDDLDAAYTWHPSSGNTVLNSGFLANVKVLFDFKGVSSHAAASPELGRSALDGVELMNVGVNYLREHMIDDARIHYAITNSGGNAPNVVQANAQVFYVIRAPKANQVSELFERVKNIANGAALMSGTEVKVRIVAGYSNFLANDTLSDILRKHSKDVIANINYENEEFEYAKKFQETFTSELKSMEQMLGIPKEMRGLAIAKQIFPSPKKLPGSSDVGDVSWVVPTGQFMGSCYAFGTPAHSWQMVSQGKSSIAHKGMISAAKIMALSTLEIFMNPSILEDVRLDHEKNLNGEVYVCPIGDETIPKMI